MGFISMSKLPGLTNRQPEPPKKNKVITMSQIHDPGTRKLKEQMIKNRRKITEVLRQGMWSGERCFIVGGGSSVRKINPKILEGEHTIGINLAFRLLDPEIIYGMDPRLWGWIESGDTGPDDRDLFNASRAIKVWGDLNAAPLPEDIFIVESIGRPGLSQNLEEGLGCGTNSGFGALNLALLLGASEIYLLGYDFSGPRWHNGYPSEPSENVHDYHLQCYEENSDEFKKFGAKIINCNKNSALKVFEFGDIPTELNPVEEKPAKKPAKLKKVERTKKEDEPIFVNYFTPENGYKKYADNLRLTLDRLSLDYDVSPVKSRGDWDANTKFKSQFILKMLDRYPGRDVIWIDADAVVVSLPEKLLNCSADIAGHYRGGKEFISSVMFFKNNDISRAFLADVEKLLKIGERRPFGEQSFFQDVLDKYRKDGKITFEDLGPEYCYIMGLQNPDVEPVIEQHQASRTLRT